MSSAPTPATTPAAAPAGPRRFGRFALRRLLGKSAHSMLWEVLEPRSGQPWLLAVPRQRIDDAAALARWLDAARTAARLQHPRLAPVVEVDVHDQWPYMACERGDAMTLAERLAAQPAAPLDVARWAAQALEGLAFAHDAGVAHGDLQLHWLLLDARGQVRVFGLAVDGPAQSGADAALQEWHTLAGRDLLALGLVLHHLVAGAPALDEPDTAAAIGRLPPLGNEIVRLPFVLPQPVPEALRAIVNRCVDRQPRQRYHNARTLLHALDGWLQLQQGQESGLQARLLDGVRRFGALPALPGGALHVMRQMERLERLRTDELAAMVLHDPALSLELLRQVNTAQVRGMQVASNGTVLTLRRAIAMVGLMGMQRAANTLKSWPGPLGREGAGALRQQLRRVQRITRVAQALRPPGYDPEVVHLVALLQCLGWLLLHYHFPQEASQVRQLMAAAPGADDAAGREESGMEESVATQAVLGMDTEAMAAAVARQWGLDAAVQHLMRRLPPLQPVRVAADSDDEVLRMVGSAACEAVEAQGLPPPQALAALERVAQRYARLGLDLERLQRALCDAMEDEEAGDPAGDEAGDVMVA